MTNQFKNRRRVARAAALCLLALGATLSQSREARAQWTTSGNNTTTTNNVGIGTTAPTDRLEINGNVANGGGLTISTSGNAKYRVGTVGTTVPNWGGQIMNAKFNQTAGNWTQDDPTLNSAFIKLDLRNLPYGNEMGFYRMAAGGTNPRPDTAWVPVAQFKLDTGNILLAPTSGNVGIGTTTPGIINGINYGAYIPLHVRATGSANILVDSADPGSGYVLNNSSQPVDGRIWAISTAAGAGKLSFSTYTDAGAASTRLVIDRTGNVGVGTTAPATKLHVVGDITVSGNINAKYQDVAEWVPSTQKLQPGTVVVLDTARDNHVLASKGAYDTRVAGVISAQPGLSLGEAGEGKLLVATTGRVRVKVDATRAPIRIGDLIVTGEAEGAAMKSEPVLLGGIFIHRPGTIIGKALEPLEKGTGEILVLLSLQ
ncbi:MAG TPA: hypothetical protein VN282_12555 [Pyrinomonadaceae bacterium]|nr:hypothetical protein [Pyrinomonadaceae bacterium]